MNLSSEINNGEDFPPLGATPLDDITKRKRTTINQSNKDHRLPDLTGPNSNSRRASTISPPSRSRCSPNSTTSRVDRSENHYANLPSTYYGDDPFSCYRIGSRLTDYELNDFDRICRQRHISKFSDFVLSPIRPIRSNLYESAHKFEAIPDLALKTQEWDRLAIDLGRPNLDYFDPIATRMFDKLLRHALYLGSSIILITCPSSDIAQATLASTINNRLKNFHNGPLIIFEVPMGCQQLNQSSHRLWCPSLISHSSTSINGTEHQLNGTDKNGSGPSTGYDSSELSTLSESYSEIKQSSLYDADNHQAEANDGCPWRLWHSFSSHLVSDKKIGVCLSIREDLIGSQDDLDRWTGESVRMIIINIDQFVRSPSNDERPELTIKCKKFVKNIMLANSLKTSLVLEGVADQDPAEYMHYLQALFMELEKEYPDPLRSWNDKLQPPLQPLSSNLDSAVYAVFETDKKKYNLYRDAMIEALDRLLLRGQDLTNDDRHEFVLMVLGAGRGPLVDMFIEAIRTVNSKHRFKIYAIDKNPSSIMSLRYKQKHQWIDTTGNDSFETEVVESDMRTWTPATGLKADIIATELLGSFGDNELSPECIDGLWNISTSRTISIPQEYSSYLAPISSNKLFQELSWLHTIDQTSFDQIYVSKLTNYYLIDRPQRLFTFDHKDLSIAPDKRCNERFKQLTFKSRTETVCHGFAGYFSAHLFGTTHMSTVEGQSTANMDSWYPAFIPLQQPIYLTTGSSIEILFWRKESSTGVWYEWTVVKPIKSRIYSQSGLNTLMSKFID